MSITTNITIDKKEYDFDQLSDKGNAQLSSMQFCDQNEVAP